MPQPLPSREKFVEIFADLFPDEAEALGVIIKIGGAQATLRQFSSMTPVHWWGYIYDLAVKGRFDKDGLSKILQAAAEIYPGNEDLQAWQTSPAGGGGAVCNITMKINGSITTESLQELTITMTEFGRSHKMSVNFDFSTTGSHNLHFSLEGASEEQVNRFMERARSVLAEDRIDGQIWREPYTFRDYFADPITVEGPDGQRFALEHIRASTLVGDIARSVMNDYQGEFATAPGKFANVASTKSNTVSGQSGRQQAVVDLMGDDGNGQRLDPRLTLHDAGVRPGAVLRVHPERTAGAVNPLMREEALARVRAQALDFAAAHPGFQIAANSPVAPTEYLLHFSVPGFAPPSGPGAAPRRAEWHEVLVYLPPNFPFQAPEAWWQTEIFHPNIDRESGAVCLGALQTHYKPGLDFGELCQMLVDIAAYRLYSTEPGNFLDSEASLWALSDDGQAAIEAVGGISVLGRLVFEGRPERSLRLRRLEQ